MPYFPHVVRANTGVQPVVIDLVHDVVVDAGGRYRIYLDVIPVGVGSGRTRYRNVRFIGRLSVSGVTSGTGASNSGGFYDTVIAFLGTAAGGNKTTTETRTTAIKAVLQGQPAILQSIGGRLVVM